MSAPGEDQCGGDDLERLIKCAELANELAKRLEKLLEREGVEIRIKDIKIERRYYSYFLGFLEYKLWIYPYDRRMVISVPADLAKNWGYLSDRIDFKYESDHVERVIVRILGQLTVGDLLMLYKMYEEGLLGKIAADAEKGVEKMKKFEKMLKKASAIAEIMGIPPA